MALAISICLNMSRSEDFLSSCMWYEACHPIRFRASPVLSPKILRLRIRVVRGPHLSHPCLLLLYRGIIKVFGHRGGRLGSPLQLRLGLGLGLGLSLPS